MSPSTPLAAPGNSVNTQYPEWLRWLAQLISLVFHPLFIVSYIMAFLIFLHPSVFSGMDPMMKKFRIAHILLLTAFLPLFAVFIMVKLKLLISSVYLKTAKERIVPYMISMIFYWWSAHVFDNLPDTPPSASLLLVGSFLGICFGFFCNIYYKISIHALALGGALGFFILFSFQDSYASGLYLSTVVLIAGLVCTSRFIVSDHTPFEIYSGLLIGLLAQVIAFALGPVI
jgi:hypothetical protein